MSRPENWLILETSGRTARLGLARGGAVVGRAELDSARRHAREMTSTVDALLKAEGLMPGRLTGVIASTGPGSYTGLRVGLATAKTLAYTLGCELRAVGAFWAIAHQAPPDAADRVAWVIADALQEQVYAQPFRRKHDGWMPLEPLRVMPAGVLGTFAPDAWVTGPGLAVYDAWLPAGVPRSPEADREPRVESLFEVGMRLVQPLTREELFSLEPLYLRGSSAEEKAAGRPG